MLGGEQLGDEALDAVADLVADLADELDICAIRLHDPAAAVPPEPADLVLGVGLSSAAETVDLLIAWSRRPPAALVVRNPLAQHEDVLAAATRSATVVLGVDPGAEWLQLSMLVRELVDAGQSDAEHPGALADDLFRVANTIAVLVNAPVTIEDPHSRVLAFSEGQERADEARRATILGRRAPDPNYARMKKHGVFRRLLQSEGALFVPGRPPDILPRIVQPVRASGEFLGSIWLVVDEPLDPERERALATAAHTVALHLLRQRLQADAWRTTEAATAASLLQGGDTAMTVARRLQINAPGLQVAAIAARQLPTLDSEATLLRLYDGLRLSLSSFHRAAIAAKIDDTVYAVAPLPHGAVIGEPHPAVRKLMHTVLRSHTAPRHAELVIGLGTAVASPAELPRSRDQALRVLQVLRDQPHVSIADITEVGAQALLKHLVSAMHDDPSLGDTDLRRLERHDADKGTPFVETIDAWLDAFGDTDTAAARLGVHPNTVRYRIRQLRDLGLVDLDDPTCRLALAMQLRHAHALGGE